MSDLQQLEQLEHEISKYMEGLNNDLKKEFEKYLKEVIQKAYIQGKNTMLSDFLTIKQIAVRLGVSDRRALALAQKAHDNYGVGVQIGGMWLFLEAELKLLQPAKQAGRPSKK